MGAPPVDDEKQLRALRAAKPLQDAEQAFLRGEQYLVANRWIHGPRIIFYGLPRTSFAARAEKTWQQRIIAASATLAANPEFLKLKEDYEVAFNSRIVDLYQVEQARETNLRRIMKTLNIDDQKPAR